MHFHLPKPLHGWREFLGEVGIVFLGVIIALGAEQLIESIHWHHRRALAENAMHEELGNDDGVMASALLARTHCVDQMLDRAETAILAGDRRRLADAMNATPPLDLRFDQTAWEAASSSQALTHGRSDSTLDWAKPYAYVSSLNTAFDNYQQHIAMLSASTRGNASMALAEQRDALVNAEAAREDSARVTRGTAAFLSQLRVLKIPLNDQDVATVLRSFRAQMGDCVIDPRTTDLFALRTPQARTAGPHAR
jgi:hypothetical protein